MMRHADRAVKPTFVLKVLDAAILILGVGLFLLLNAFFCLLAWGMAMTGTL
jgi:hypothetical protein